MCIGTMKGFREIEGWSSEDMANWPCASEDEVDIVGEATMDESAHEDHLHLLSPYVPYCPIVECMGLSRAAWVNLDVVLVDNNGVLVVEGIFRNTHPQECIDENPFGTKDVGVIILESLVHSEVDPTHRFSLRMWPLKNVTIDGITLREHE